MADTNENDHNEHDMTPEERQASIDAAVQDRDVRARGVLIAAILILALIMVSFAVPAILVTLLSGPEAPERQDQIVPNATPEPPPGPRLQSNEYADWEQVKREETQKLTEYRYTNPERTEAVIPIERAMDILVEERMIKVRPGGERMDIDREGFLEPEAADWTSGQDIQSGR